MAAAVSHRGWACEELDQDEAGDETADVRPEGYATLLLHGEPRQAAHELDQRPVEDHRPGGQRDGRQQEADGHQREDAYAWIENQVAPHDAADSTRGTHHRDH